MIIILFVTTTIIIILRFLEPSLKSFTSQKTCISETIFIHIYLSFIFVMFCFLHLLRVGEEEPSAESRVCDKAGRTFGLAKVWKEVKPYSSHSKSFAFSNFLIHLKTPQEQKICSICLPYLPLKDIRLDICVFKK